MCAEFSFLNVWQSIPQSWVEDAPHGHTCTKRCNCWVRRRQMANLALTCSLNFSFIPYSSMIRSASFSPWISILSLPFDPPHQAASLTRPPLPHHNPTKGHTGAQSCNCTSKRAVWIAEMREKSHGLMAMVMLSPEAGGEKGSILLIYLLSSWADPKFSL